MKSFVTIYFVDPDNNRTKVIASVGENLLEVAHKYGVKIKANCGGKCSCTTCHCYIQCSYFDSFEELYYISEAEMDRLETNSAIEYNSRLVCQIFVTKNMHNMTVQIEEKSYGKPDH